MTTSAATTSPDANAMLPKRGPETSKTRRFARNAVWNVAGQLLPIAVAVAVLPFLLRAIGVERFGFLTLAWALVGYAGLFDFGISRAMTRVVARRLAAGDHAGARHSAGVATTYMLAFGVLSGALLAGCAEPIVDKWLTVPASMRDEAVHGLWLLALSVPAVLLTGAYRGYLEAAQAFRPLNEIRIVMGVAVYVVPLAAALLSARLEWVIGAVVLTRIVANFVHARAALRHCAFTYTWNRLDKPTSVELFAIGGWLSVSNVVGPLMTYMDRFILGGLVAVQMVAYYATPYDLITKTLVLPFALMGVLFPMMSGQNDDCEALRDTYGATVRMLLILMFPVSFIAIVLGGPFLGAWLGENFAVEGTRVLQILAVGVFFNALAQAPANLIQGAGQPRSIALLHVCELPFYLCAIWLLTREFGIAGTALAWSARSMVDCALMYQVAGRDVVSTGMSGGRLALSLLVVSLLFVAGAAAQSVPQALVGAVLGAALFGVFAWTCLLTAGDKARLAGLMPRHRGRGE